MTVVNTGGSLRSPGVASRAGLTIRVTGRSAVMEGWCSVSVPISRASGMPAFTRRSQPGTEKGQGSSMKSIRLLRWCGRDFQNWSASFPSREPLKSSRQRQEGTMEASMVSRSRAAAGLELALIFPALKPFVSMILIVAGLTQTGKGGMAGRNVEAGEQADAGGARLPVSPARIPGPVCPGAADCLS